VKLTQPNNVFKFSTVVLAHIAAFLALVFPLPNTLSAYTDTESGKFSLIAVAPPSAMTPGLHPVAAYMGSTMMAIGSDGAAYIWGYRNGGISGTGTASVTGTSAISRVELPGGRKIVQLAGGTQDNFEDGISSLVAALADDGTVWTWGAASDALLARTTSSAAMRATPGQVTTIPADDRVVDIKATESTMLALTESGKVYSWGNPKSFGALGQGSSSSGSSTARLILTGIHSIGSTVWSAWAIATPAWTKCTYAKETSASCNSANGDGKAGVLFWGVNDEYSGSPAGDPDFSSAITYTPTKLGTNAQLNKLLAAGTTAGDDNLTLGVAMGSPEDNGTFRQLSGGNYGNVALLRNGQVYAWGNSDRFSSGRNAETVTKAKQIPTLISIQQSGSTLKIVQVAHTNGLFLLLDETNTVWMYGLRPIGDTYPTANGQSGGSSNASPSSVPVRINGGTTYPGWAEGTIAEVAGTGFSLSIKKTDGSFWIVGGSQQNQNTNTVAIVRNGTTTNSTSTSSAQPLTKLVAPAGYGE
jgi:alpha-tubulin suppressor-like RCC1 family protein